MSITRLAAWITICLGLSACSSGPGSIDGTIAGRSFAPRSAISGVASDGKTLLVILTDFPGACDAVAACSLSKGGQMLEFALENKNMAGALGLGSYSLTGSAMEAGIGYFGCAPGSPSANLVVGETGTVSLTAENGQGFDGRVEAKLSDGSQISGSFTTSPCPALGAAAFGNCAFSCQP